MIKWGYKYIYLEYQQAIWTEKKIEDIKDDFK